MISLNELDTLRSATVVASDGTELGSAGQIWADTATGQPEWVSVHTGGRRETIVPITDASLSGGKLLVPFTGEQVTSAPHIDEHGDLSQKQEAELYAHYNYSYSDDRSSSGLPDGGQVGKGYVDQGQVAQGTVAQGYVDQGTVGDLNRDDAMTRSEEQLHVGTEKVQTGVARLRKYVETETVNVPVTVTKEKVRLEREPITDANRADALDGPEITENEYEVTLTEERPIVSKETVPVERVRLAKDVETETVNVAETLRKERIETDGVDGVDLGDVKKDNAKR